MIGPAGKVLSDASMVFFNQPGGPSDPVELSMATKLWTFDIRPSRAPAEVEKFYLTIAGEGPVRDVKGLVVEARSTGQSIQLKAPEFNEEKAVILAEVYRHSSGWKIRSIMQGFNGGLGPLARHFGVDVGEPQTAIETTSAPPPPAPVAPPPAAVPAAPVAAPPAPVPQAAASAGPSSINLSKKGERSAINLVNDKPITAYLKWESRGDLDLYCLWVDVAGHAGMTYYRRLGSPGEAPHVQLLGDSTEPGVETVLIHKPEALRYATIAAYSALSNGVGSFKSFGARAVVDNGAGQVVTCGLNEKSSFSYWTVIALIDFTVKGEARVSQVESYGKRFSERAPVLSPDGSIKMSAGVVEFK
ncbi:TerD family protein [Chenggangzhangella methanolivorans]|uniref:TerD family protein n=2 Tax=Chenggangzhangella methanolivorans TaxID=1437009 RepID=A0A9E6RA80_9HYPH|nr:TerD family protein [Chenggangzhangella methanolivorans]QZO00655.1 TerD family protein [Chenggangzhangella methanolivorans]